MVAFDGMGILRFGRKQKGRARAIAIDQHSDEGQVIGF